MATRTGKRVTKALVNTKNKAHDTYEALAEEYRKASTMSCLPSEQFRKVKVGDVLDEEKSVRWNREEVERLRNEYEEEVKRLNREKNAAINDIVTRIVTLIAEDTNLPEEKARRLWNFVHAKYHAFGETVVMLDEYIQLVCDLME